MQMDSIALAPILPLTAGKVRGTHRRLSYAEGSPTLPADFELSLERARSRQYESPHKLRSRFPALTSSSSERVWINLRYSSSLNSRNAIALDIGCSLAGEEAGDEKRSTARRGPATWSTPAYASRSLVFAANCLPLITLESC